MSTNQFSVAGQTAIITGSSRGIGRAIAEQFAEDGADVVVCSRTKEDLDRVADAINESDAPGQALPVEFDVRDRSSVEALVQATVDEFAGVDCLVNNAGASFVSDFEDLSENAWGTIIDINLNGPFRCTQVAGEKMREDGGGSVINVSSIAGHWGAGYHAHYGASKAGLINLTSSLAYEWGRQGIRVNCIAPGIVVTEGAQEAMGVMPEEIDRGDPDRQTGLPVEVADIAQFLASPAASFVTGETVDIKGVPPIEMLSGK
jgi:NAD(P)-dependent dehydrogenase (short-subunit alcohol dehydrogenase family)